MILSCTTSGPSVKTIQSLPFDIEFKGVDCGSVIKKKKVLPLKLSQESTKVGNFNSLFENTDPSACEIKKCMIIDSDKLTEHQSANLTIES